MIRLLAAEWLKVRTTHLLAATVPAAVAISCAAVAGAVLAADNEAELESSHGVRAVFSVTGTGAVLVLVAGIVVAAGEYRHGTAAGTFLTTPRRGAVVGAKLALGACGGAGVGALSAGACIALATILYPTRDAAFPLSDGEVWATLGGAIVYAALFAIIGVALGSLLRNQVVAVAGALAWLAIIEHTLVNIVPALGRWLPAAAGQAIVRTPLDGLLAPAAGVAVLTAYAVALASAAIRAEVARDV